MSWGGIALGCEPKGCSEETERGCFIIKVSVQVPVQVCYVNEGCSLRLAESREAERQHKALV